MRTEPRRGGVRRMLFSIPLMVVAAAGGTLYWQYTAKDRLIAEQKRVIAELARKLDRAWASELVADVRVDRVGTSTEGQPEMDLTFVQYKPGTELPSLQRSFTLKGEEFYLDALVVQFDRALVENGDPLKGKSMLLFRRAFGDRQQPAEGVSLYREFGDSPIPEIAQVDAAPTEFEQQLWRRFWTVASDPQAASNEGIRVAQGEAPHIKAVEGQVYKVTLRAGGGLEIKPRLPASMVGKHK